MIVTFDNEKDDIFKEEEPVPEEYIDHRIKTKIQNNNIKQNKNQIQEKLTPSNHHFNSITEINNDKKEIQNIQYLNSNKNYNQLYSEKKTNTQTNKTNNNYQEKTNPNYINTNIDNNNISKNNNLSYISKAKTTLPNYNDTKYDKYNIQKMYYNIQKDYSHLHIDKNEEFLNRMQFDIYKRQLKEDKINKLIQKNKIKIDENDRIKTFNRLIKDANRRLEAQEKLENSKKCINNEIRNTNNKKYNEKEWEEIYNKRFRNYEEFINKKKEENKKMYRIEKIAIENEEIKLCPTKKATQKHIEENAQRMYDESKKRKLKMNEKIMRLNNYNFDDSPNKYVKKIKSEAYNFADDDEYNIYDLNNLNSIESNDYYIGKNPTYKHKNKLMKKTKGMAVSEFNNKRFDTKLRNGKSCSSTNLNKYNKNILNDCFFNNILNNNNNIKYEDEKNKNNIIDNYNLEEERNKLIKMASLKNLQQINQNDKENENVNNIININDNNENSRNYKQNNNNSEVNDMIEQFIIMNLNDN